VPPLYAKKHNIAIMVNTTAIRGLNNTYARMLIFFLRDSFFILFPHFE